MSAIGLVTSTVGGNAANRVEAALVADGHTVTQIDHDPYASGATAYTPYDHIVTVLMGRSSGFATKTREVIQSGRGVVVCCDLTPDGTQTPMLNLAGLHAGSSFIYVSGNSKDIVVTDDSHPITAGYTEGAQTPVLAANARRVQGLTGAVEGTLLATSDPDNASLSGKAAIVAYEIGTPYLTSPFVNTLARVVFLGFAPDTTTLDTAGTEIIQRAVAWGLAGGLTPPVLSITNPPDATEYTFGDPISFEGEATDAEDGDISADIEWESDMDGPLGSGASLEVFWLSEGDHTITASVTDSDDLTDSAEIAVSVVAAAGNRPDTPTLELAADPTDDAVAVTLGLYSHPDTPDPDAEHLRGRGRVARADGSLIRAIDEFTPDSTGEWRTLVLDLLTEDGFIFVQYQDRALRWSYESAGLAYELDTTPVDAPPAPAGEPGGEVSEFLYRSEWEWGTSAANLLVYNPLGETYTDLFTRTIFVYDDEDTLLARITKWDFQGVVTGGVEQWIGFLRPGHTYTVVTTWKYRNGGNYKFSPAREFEVDVPPALDAPRITAPECGALVSGADINITWEESLDCVLEPGTDLIEISRNGPTWAAVGSLASGGANAIDVDWADYPDGIAWLGITRVTGGGSSARRVSKPFFIDNGDVGIRYGIGELDLGDFTIEGSVGEAARWSDTGGVLRRDGVATTAGYLILDEAGELRTVDIVADVQFATADGTGNALQYSPDMRSHVGVGAYMGANFQALAVRFRGAFGAFGRLTGQGEGQDAAEWFAGTRQGKGLGYLQPIANNGSVTAHSILATPSREQWMPNTRTGDPWFAVGGRFEQEETYLDGTMRFGVQSLLTGPGSEGAPQLSDVNRNAVTIPCGGCGISVLSESASVVLIRSLTVYPISEGDCAAEGELGGPCMLELTVYEADNETIAWQSTTSPTWLGESGVAVPYLQDPLQIGGGYGEQEVDFAAGTASIGQCNVRMIDPPTAGLMSPGVLNDQDSGWMTERKTTVAGRRNRLRRFIDEDQGWVTIADGPGGFPKLLGSFAGYEWAIRDTREKERRLRAFAGTSPTVILPFGLLEGQWGAYGEYGQALIEEAGYIKAMFIDDPEMSPTGGYFMVFEKPDGVPFYPLYNAAMGRATEQTLFPGTVYFPSGYYPNVAVLWRLVGEGDGDWKYAGQQPGGGTAESERRVLAPTPGYLMFQEEFEGTPGVISLIWVTFETGEMPGPGGTEVEFYVLYVGPANEAFPFYLDGLTAGQLLKNLYDGLYSPRDPLTGAVVPTGIRYDEDALLLLTTLVRLRVTEPVKDIRAWAEKNIYAPLGYAPALDADGQISPVSQEIPSSIYTYEFFDFTEITNAITQAVPGHAPGDNVINILSFKFGRAYSDPVNSTAIDGLVIQDLELLTRDPATVESIERHGEKEIGIETVAFVAVGDEAGRPIGDEVATGLFAARWEHLLARRINGTDLCVVPVMRIATYWLRVGDWVHVTLSWLPNDNTGRRSLDHLAQVLAIKDPNCSWREMTFELVQPWPAVSP